MKKIVVVISYYNRPWHLRRTLESIDAYNDPNLEIVIVDDGSPVSDINPVNTGGNRHVIRINPNNKKWVTPVAPINMGFQKALDLDADIIIEQNPECLWIGDIARYARENVTDNNYTAFSCFSLDKDNTFDPEIESKLPAIIEANNVCATYDGGNFWYNHPVHRAVAYDFCCAISRDTLLRLNGMDERFSQGYWYSDNNWVDRMKRAGLQINIPHPESNPFVIHQWHYDNPENPNKEVLINVNKVLYDFINEAERTIYKATHIITPNLVDARALVDDQVKEV